MALLSRCSNTYTQARLDIEAVQIGRHSILKYQCGQKLSRCDIVRVPPLNRRVNGIVWQSIIIYHG